MGGEIMCEHTALIHLVYCDQVICTMCGSIWERKPYECTYTYPRDVKVWTGDGTTTEIKYV
jgi:hypothetical protein